MNYDVILRKLLTLKNGNPNGNKFLKIQQKYPNILSYIKNRWNDSESLKESFHRLIYNIEVHPKCPVCGKPTHLGRRGQFSICCSRQCSTKYEKTQEKAKHTFLKHYGVSNPAKSNLIKEKIKQTCLERYGEECNFAGKIFREKVQQKMIHKYGVDNPLKNDIIKQKVKQTQIDKYGGVGLQSIYIYKKKSSINMYELLWSIESWINFRNKGKGC